MNIEVPEAMSWFMPGTLGLIFLGLGTTAWWLFRQRRRHEMRQELADELAQCVSRLGLGTVWQAPLFQADVFGIRGLVDGFDVRAELWDKSSHEFFRLTIHFPQSTRQELRLRAGKAPGTEKLWRMDPITTGHQRFDEVYKAYGRFDEDEQAKEVLTARVRRLLLSFVDDVDGIRIGDNSLYLFVDDGIDTDRVECLVRDALAASVELYSQARKAGPSQATDTMAYERVSDDVLGRETGKFSHEELPSGTGAFEGITGAEADLGEDSEEDESSHKEKEDEEAHSARRETESSHSTSEVSESTSEDSESTSEDSESLDESSPRPSPSFPAVDPESVDEVSSSGESWPGSGDPSDTSS